MSFNTASIRGGTRVALPAQDTYLFRLGVALYGFASINSFMTELICHVDSSIDRNSLLGLTSGQVLDRFRAVGKRWRGSDISTDVAEAAKQFERLNTERSDFVHAYPITNSAGEQILHRRVDDKNKYFEVSEVFLDDFISRLTLVSDALYRIRGVVKPNL